MKKLFLFGLSASMAMGGFSVFGDSTVMLISDAKANSVFRFRVSDDGLTWTELEPYANLGMGAICNIIPAHGCYYVCNGDGDIYRCTKDFTTKTKLTTDATKLSGCGGYEMSSDQAYIYGANMNMNAGANCIKRFHIGRREKTDYITNAPFAQVRNMYFGKDGLLYCGSRGGPGTGYDGSSVTGDGGVFAFDCSNGTGPVLKTRYVTVHGERGADGSVVMDGNRVMTSSGSNIYVFGREEEGTDGDVIDLFRYRRTGLSLSNAFAASTVGGRTYFVSWRNSTTTAAEVQLVTETNAVIKVADLTTSQSTALPGVNLTSAHQIREETFPEVDSTEAICQLLEYWSFAGTGDCRSLVNTVRLASCDAGFTKGVRGAVREGLWAEPGARGKLQSAIIVPQNGDFSFAFFAGFPDALRGEQILFKNPKVTLSVTADGLFKFAIPDGQDAAGAMASGTVAIGQTNVADGLWHHFVATRRANRLEVWVDGVKDGESPNTTTVRTFDDFGTQWAMLDAANPNRQFLDEIRIYGAALTEGDVRLLQSLATDGLKVPEAPYGVADRAAAEAYGTVIAHSPLSAHAWGAPSLVADADGQTLYLAAGFARGLGTNTNDQASFWKSTDGGTTWTKQTGISAAGAVALYRPQNATSGQLGLFGVDPASACPFTGVSANGGSTWVFHPLTWNPPLTGDGAGNATIYPSVAYSSQLGRYCVNSSQGVLTFLHNTDWQFYYPTYVTLANCANYRQTGLVPGGVMTGPNGYPAGLFAQYLPKHDKDVNDYVVESALVYRRQADEKNTNNGLTCALSFRGVSHPFGVVYDVTSKAWWAVVPTAPLSAVKPWQQANTLALWCAKDCATWEYCCDVLTADDPAKVGFLNPAVEIVGNDLVVVFGASVADRAGDTSARDVQTANFLLMRKIANFRARTPAASKRTRTLLVQNPSANCIQKLTQDPASGTWVMDGFFGSGCGNDIAVCGDRVYVLAGAVVSAYDFKGELVRTYDLTTAATGLAAQPADMGLGFSYDGKYMFTVKAWDAGGTIFKTDLATGTTSIFFTDTGDVGCPPSGVFARVRAVTGLKDGRIVCSCRDSNRLVAFSAEGAYLSMVASSSPQTLFLDRRHQRLYASGFSANLLAYSVGDPLKWIDTKGSTYSNTIGICGDKKGAVYGSAYGSNNYAMLCDMLSGEGESAPAGFKTILYGGLQFNRCAFFDTALPPGLTMIFR